MQDATDLVVSILGAAFEASGIPVSDGLPQMDETGPIGPCITVTQTGGTSDPWLSHPVMQVLAWDEDAATANALVNDCAVALSEAAMTHDKLSHVEVAAIAQDTFAVTGTQRYRLTVKLTINE